VNPKEIRIVIISHSEADHLLTCRTFAIKDEFFLVFKYFV